MRQVEVRLSSLTLVRWDSNALFAGSLIAIAKRIYNILYDFNAIRFFVTADESAFSSVSRKIGKYRIFNKVSFFEYKAYRKHDQA